MVSADQALRPPESLSLSLNHGTNSKLSSVPVSHRQTSGVADIVVVGCEDENHSLYTFIQLCCKFFFESRSFIRALTSRGAPVGLVTFRNVVPLSLCLLVLQDYNLCCSSIPLRNFRALLCPEFALYMKQAIFNI